MSKLIKILTPKPLQKKEAAAQAAAAAGQAPGAAVAEKVKEKQIGERKEDLRAAAGAAGAAHTASDYDMLGISKNQVKRKSASKSLLGE